MIFLLIWVFWLNPPNFAPTDRQFRMYNINFYINRKRPVINTQWHLDFLITVFCLQTINIEKNYILSLFFIFSSVTPGETS